MGQKKERRDVRLFLVITDVTRRGRRHVRERTHLESLLQ